MTITDSDPTATVPYSVGAQVPAHVSQGTAIEQARAVAEVQGAIIVAQQCPRDQAKAIRSMTESCQQKALAERAFFRYNRAGSAITGPTVHLARELARCFGNVQYGIVELRRDDGRRESEMLAFAWDVETNTRATTTFIVKHIRDTQKGPRALVDQRDLYENNANMGARRLREQIFAIIPTWFVEQAKDICNATLRDGGGKPLPQRIAEAIKLFESIGVVTDQLEAHCGRPSAKWTEHDIAALGVTFKSIRNGEILAEDEFPPRRVSMDDVNQQQPPARPARTRAAGATPAEPDDSFFAGLNAEADAQAAERDA